MKHKLIVLACVVIVLALGATSVAVWHTERAQTKIRAAKAAGHAAYIERVRKDTVTSEINRINAECNKGQVAWDALKTKVGTRPVCNLEIVQ